MVAVGIDFLAAGIGNIHGPYPANWEGLDLDHLKEIDRSSSRIPNRIAQWIQVSPDEQIKLSSGVAKVNVNTECQITHSQAWRQFVREYSANEAEYDKKNSSTT